MRNVVAEASESVREAHRAWGWYVALGIALILVGVYAIMSGTAATIASVIVLGAVVFVAGIAQIVGAFMARGAGHVILLLLVGILDVVVGLMLVEHPGAGALTVTLLLAVLFTFSGIYRFVAALWLQFPQYGWVALSALLSVAVGVLLWIEWPFSSSWFIGFAVGVNFVVAGIAWSIVGWRLKSA